MTLITRRLARSLAALALVLVAATAIPQSPERYVVEVVVFRPTALTGTPPGVTALPPGESEVEPELSSSRKLQVAANRLRNSGNYRVLAHSAWIQSPTPFDSGRGVSAARLGMVSAGINGKIVFERGGRYLHLGIDLAVEDGGNRYRLTEFRKQVKADETQYFDHPALGVIAIITPAD